MITQGTAAARILAVLALLMLACGREQPASVGAATVQVTGAWARPAKTGDTGAVYFVIENHGGQDDTLTGVTSPVAESVEVHQSTMSGNVAHMAPAQSVGVPAGKSVKFEPGGYHVMLVKLKQDLVLGEPFPVTLQFERSGDISVQVAVRQQQG